MRREKIPHDLVGVIRAAHQRYNEDNENHAGGDDSRATLDGTSVTELSPGAVGLLAVFLELVGAELVVHHATEGNGVTEQLEGGHRGVKPECGNRDENDILEDTTESENEGGGFANLFVSSALHTNSLSAD